LGYKLNLQEVTLKWTLVLKKLLCLSVVFFLFFTISHADQIIISKSKKEQYKITMDDLKVFQEAILDYIFDNNQAPEAETIEELLQLDVGNGLTFASLFLSEIEEEKIPRKDAWGNDFLYKYQKEQFWIASPGNDGAFEGFEQKGVYLNTDKELEGKDIIITNDGFVFFPIDKQQLYFLQLFFKMGAAPPAQDAPQPAEKSGNSE
jgi:hypothetical protein